MRPSAFLPLPSAASSVSALGINCRGSALCDIGFVGGNLAGLIKLVEDIPDGKTFNPKQHIACQGHLCAFTQHWAEDVTKELALEKLNDLK